MPCLGKDASEVMQFILMMYGCSVLINEIHMDHPEHDLGNLTKFAAEVGVNKVVIYTDIRLRSLRLKQF